VFVHARGLSSGFGSRADGWAGDERADNRTDRCIERWRGQRPTHVHDHE
jgi:hypothetical protein